MIESVPPLKMLYLWSLVAKGGSEWLQEIRPRLEARDRKPLLEAGLIAESRERRETGGKAVFAKRVLLTDKGWGFIQKHAAAPVNARTPAASDVLQGVLNALDKLMRNREFTLAEIFGAAAPVSMIAEEIAEAPAKEAVWARLRREWSGLSGADGGARLRDVRQALRDIPRSALDRALVELQNEGRLVLYPLDDPAATREGDSEAALMVAGRKVHLVFLK